jgi:hypothetical protein
VLSADAIELVTAEDLLAPVSDAPLEQHAQLAVSPEEWAAFAKALREPR